MQQLVFLRFHTSKMILQQYDSTPKGCFHLTKPLLIWSWWWFRLTLLLLQKEMWKCWVYFLVFDTFPYRHVVLLQWFQKFHADDFELWWKNVAWNNQHHLINKGWIDLVQTYTEILWIFLSVAIRLCCLFGIFWLVYLQLVLPKVCYAGLALEWK